MRFERDPGSGFERIFAETFAFRAERHDPAELYLQLEDVWTKPQLIAGKANRRDAEAVVARLAEAMPAYLERVMDRLEQQAGVDGRILTHVHEDVGLLASIMGRFITDKRLDEDDRLRTAELHLRKIAHRSFRSLVEDRVDPAYVDAYLAGDADPVDPADDLSEIGFFYTLQMGDEDAVNRGVVRMAERAFYRWLEDVCLAEDGAVFETEDSPFADREDEVLAAACAPGADHIERARDLAPFLRRPQNRDCLRVLRKLETWFLRRYDVPHGAAIIHHSARIAKGEVEPERVLSVHGTRNYLIELGLIALPFLGAAFAYDRFPQVFDWAAALLAAGGVFGTFWFFVYRFCWKRDLTFFHASAPRITAGIIVGYAPVFLIDEVWDLARSPWPQLAVVTGLLGFSTLLYLYVEVKGRIPDPSEAFHRARDIFLLGLVEAVGIGIVITSLLGPFMAARNWGPEGSAMTVDQLAHGAGPVLGQLPAILGVAPFYAFPSAVVLFTFLSFFIGTFLQLLWEDLPITEPM